MVLISNVNFSVIQRDEFEFYSEEVIYGMGIQTTND